MTRVPQYYMGVVLIKNAKEDKFIVIIRLTAAGEKRKIILLYKSNGIR